MATGSSFDEAMLHNSPSPNAVDYSSRERHIVQEELEKKLRCRAERDALVQKNILPAVSASSIILAQTQQLARAKTADSLQQKLRDRISRSELHERNILPDINDAVDPSLHAQQLQLQKRKLADNLNDRIANRPGVLELVEGHILEPTNIGLVEAVNAVRSSMSPCRESDQQQQQRDTKFSDSSSPMQSPGDPYSEVSSPPRLASPSGLIPPPSILSRSSLKMSGEVGKAPSPSQSRKKQQKGKYRKLRYHEYVPPTKSNGKGGKTTPSKPPKLDTPYALLLQQQQVFLQLQVLQQQYPNGVLAQKLPELLKNVPASITEKAQAMLKPKLAGMESHKTIKTHEIPEDIKVQGPNGSVITVRLDELKVNNLKVACKEMNLIVSGKKIELIERLLEHNNGVLPSTVLQDQKKSVSQASSFESQLSNTSPESPSPSPVFQYPKSLGSSSLPSFFQTKDAAAATNTMDVASDLPEVVPASDFQNEFDQLIQKRKVDYLSSKSMKAVAPRPDLKHMVAIKLSCSQVVPETAPKSTARNFIQSQSLPSSPQQLSPTESASDLLQDLMEQSPLPLSQSTISPDPLLVTTSNTSNVSPSHTNIMTGPLVSANQYAVPRRGRCSLPNPPPYPGLHPAHVPAHSYNHAPANYLYPRSGPHRSFSVSGPSSNRSMSLDMPPPPSTLLAQSNKPLGPPSDNFLFPADEGAPASELMDIDHNQLSDLLEMFDQGDQGLTFGGPSLNHSSFGSGANNRLQTHHETTSENTSYMQQGLLNSDLSFMGASRDVKPGLGAAPTAGVFNDMSWLNIDSGSLLNHSMHGYVPDMSNSMTGSLQPYEHFQLGLDDSAALKSSSGSINALTSSNEMHPFLDSGNHCSMYGGHDSALLNLDLAS